MDFNSFWRDAVSQSKELSGDDLIPFVAKKFAKIDSDDIENISKALLNQLSSLESKEHVAVFCKLLVINLITWALGDLDSRLNTTVEIVNDYLNTIDTETFVVALREGCGNIFCIGEMENPIDMNVFLAIQGPLFFYCVNDNKDSSIVAEKWFYNICENHAANIFGENKEKALNYFKLMNHAFIQTAILPISPEVGAGEPVEPKFIEMQKHLKRAIAAVATELDEL